MTTTKARAVAALIGGCSNTTLIADAERAANKWRASIQRGDVSAETAWQSSNVGYPYMSTPDSTAAKAAFLRAVAS